MFNLCIFSVAVPNSESRAVSLIQKRLLTTQVNLDMKANDDSSDESSDSSITDSFAGVISTMSAASSEEAHDETAGMDGLDIACRRVRFAQEALQHGHGKRHNMVKERLGVNIPEDFRDDSGSRSPPLRSGPPNIAGTCCAPKSLISCGRF